jgi:hypothetical protein
MGVRYQTGALERRKTALGLCWFMRFRGPTALVLASVSAYSAR